MVSLRLTVDVLAGLHYAMGKGVTHRDMKLSNVLISSHGRAKLVDFGLAAISADMSEEAIAAAPNPRSIDYAGLERITGVRKNDTRSDIYFTGCMFYHMLSGHSPLYETRDRMKRLSVARFRDITPLGEIVPDIPNYVIAFCNKAMELKVERRYQTPGEMLEDLNQVMNRVKSGDQGVRISKESPVSESSADLIANNQDASLEREGEDRTVLLIESSISMQDAIRNALKRRGYRVLVFGDPHRAIQRFEDHREIETLADCVIVSASELGDEAVEVFNRLGESEHTKHLPAILLVKRDDQHHTARAKTCEHRVLLPLGLKIKDLRQAGRADGGEGTQPFLNTRSRIPGHAPPAMVPRPWAVQAAGLPTTGGAPCRA